MYCKISTLLVLDKSIFPANHICKINFINTFHPLTYSRIVQLSSLSLRKRNEILTWFENWFGTEYYKLLYCNRDEEEAQNFLDNLLAYLHLPENASIVDVGCGQGRHSIYLAEKGFQVTGLDYAEENIETARAEAPENAVFIEHDMREPFPVKNMDLALNIFTSFGYFNSESEDVKTVKNICNSLHNGGFAVIDFFNANKVEKNLVKSGKIEREGIVFNITKEIKDRTVYKTIEVTDGEEEHHYQERVKLLTLDDFRKYFAETCFILQDVFGNYMLEKYDENSSDRLIMVLKKVES
ncbi:MAG: class I SAM-dependent methyltransferase [Sphingobacteriales bacterium]|nr:MAG: class I SAM-dependent methyltransferase [Sphingobacteriales bacterium]